MSASEEEVAIRTAFKEYDVDNDGKIDISELCTLAQDLNLPFTDPDELTTALKALDENSSGAIDLEEFIHWWKGIKTTAVTSELQQKLADLAAAGKDKHHTDIHVAAWTGRGDLVSQFIDLDSSLVTAEDQTEYGDRNQPLHYAAYNGFTSICDTLLSAGARVDCQNAAGCTPLFLASQQGQLEVVQLLLDRKANPALQDNQFGYSAIDVAASEDIRTLLASKVRMSVPPMPTNVRVKQRNGSVCVSWSPPSSTAAAAARSAVPPPTAYTLAVYGPLDPSSCTPGDAPDPASLTESLEISSMEIAHDVADATIDGLTRGSLYAFKVTAINSLGPGQPAVSKCTLVANAPSKPGPPSLSVDPSGSVTVSWEASAAEASDAPVLGYRIVSRPAGAQEDAFTVLASVGKGATRATLDSLARGVGYEIKVYAFNVGGLSPSSDIAVVTVPRHPTPAWKQAARARADPPVQPPAAMGVV